MEKRQRKFKYLKGEYATGDGVAKAIQALLDAHPGQRNTFAAVDWEFDEGVLIEMHFEPCDSLTNGTTGSVTSVTSTNCASPALSART